MADSNKEAVAGMKPKTGPTDRPKVGEAKDGAAQAFADLKGKYIVIDARSGHNPMNHGEVQYSIRLVGVDKERLREETAALPKEIGLQARLIAGVAKVIDINGKAVEPKPAPASEGGDGKGE